MKFQKLISNSVFLFIIALLLIPTTCLALVSPTSKFYVNDYADILYPKV